MGQFFSHKITLLAAGVATILIAISLQSNIQTSTSSHKVGVLEQEIEKRSSEVSKLENQISDAQSDFYKKKIIHDELLLQEPDQQVIQLPPRPETISTQEEAPNPPTPWEEWKKILF